MISPFQIRTASPHPFVIRRPLRQIGRNGQFRSQMMADLHGHEQFAVLRVVWMWNRADRNRSQQSLHWPVFYQSQSDKVREAKVDASADTAIRPNIRMTWSTIRYDGAILVRPFQPLYGLVAVHLDNVKCLKVEAGLRSSLVHQSCQPRNEPMHPRERRYVLAIRVTSQTSV